MAQEIDLQIRFTAEDLYVKQRLTYEKIAAELGVALNTVKNWSQDGNWRTKRAEHLERRRGLNQKLVELRDAMMDKALSSQDPQTAFAALRIMQMEQDQERKSATQAPDIDRPKIFLEDLEFIATTLKEIDPEGLKALARNFDELINRFKTQHAQTT